MSIQIRSNKDLPIMKKFANLSLNCQDIINSLAVQVLIGEYGDSTKIPLSLRVKCYWGRCATQLKDTNNGMYNYTTRRTIDSLLSTKGFTILLRMLEKHVIAITIFNEALDNEERIITNLISKEKGWSIDESGFLWVKKRVTSTGRGVMYIVSSKRVVMSGNGVPRNLEDPGFLITRSVETTVKRVGGAFVHTECRGTLKERKYLDINGFLEADYFNKIKNGGR